MTTQNKISVWFDEGVSDGKKYMVVKCDTFDWTDYPEYYDSMNIVRGVVQHPGSMQKVMEVYDLEQPKRPQLLEHRCRADLK